MTWSWQLDGWPAFQWQEGLLAKQEQKFIEGASVTIGALRHLVEADREGFIIELLSGDAVSTSAIEGETLDRDSVQSSLRKQLGLQPTAPRSKPAEAGIAEMLADLYRAPKAALNQERLFAWHSMVMNGRRDVADIGRYRSHQEPMQILSGAIGQERIHYEAPPSSQVPAEMDALLDWFAHTAPEGPAPMPAITRAAIAHLWFECIHPFEDGNGRIGRAISENALAQATSTPMFTALSGALLRHRKAYYKELERFSVTLKIDGWLTWFAERALEAQADADRLVRFLIQKTQLFDRLTGKLNVRQEKALLRVFAEGPSGFRGGLSAANYAAITGVAPATVTRDLGELVALGALHRTGERKATRYWLAIEASNG